MSSRRLQARVPSATAIGPGILAGHRLVFHKVSKDGSAKCDVVESGSDRVRGVLFEIDEAEKEVLDRVEGLGAGYGQKTVEIRLQPAVHASAFTYFATNVDAGLRPYTWYKRHVLEGAREARLPHAHIEALERVTAIEDPNKEREARELAIYSGQPARNPYLPFELPRLRFRPFRADDLRSFHGYRSKAEVARFQGWAPMTLAEARRFMEKQMRVDRLTPGAWSQLAIADRGSDTLVGDVGLWLSSDSSEAEFGLTLSPEIQGRGFGTEAIRGIIDFLTLATPAKIVTAASDVRNAPCLGALRSAGMEHVATREQEYKGETCTEQVFRRRRADGA